MRRNSLPLLVSLSALQLGFVGAVQGNGEASDGMSPLAETSGDVGDQTWEDFEAILKRNGNWEKMMASEAGPKALEIWKRIFATKEVEDQIEVAKLRDAFKELDSKKATVDTYLKLEAFQNLDAAMLKTLGENELDVLRAGSMGIKEAGRATISNVLAEELPNQRKVTIDGFPGTGDATRDTTREFFNGDYFEWDDSKERRCFGGQPTFWKKDNSGDPARPFIFWNKELGCWGMQIESQWRKLADMEQHTVSDRYPYGYPWKAYAWFQPGELATDLHLAVAQVGDGDKQVSLLVQDGIVVNKRNKKENMEPTFAWLKEVRISAVAPTDVVNIYDCSKED